MGKLTSLGAKNAVRPGRYADGDGLSLVVKADRRTWVLRVTHAGRAREFGIGPASDVSLAQARAKATALRAQVKDGADPLADKRAAKAKRDTAATQTFRAAAEQCHASLSPGFRNPKHRAQWLTTLTTYAYPTLADVPVAKVTGPMVVEALRPIWLVKPETARRVRQRVGAVLQWAECMEWRAAAPSLAAITARTLAPQGSFVKHYAAVPYADAPCVLATLRDAPETVGRVALQFLILTAMRTEAVRYSTWGQIDLRAAVWTVPAERHKLGKRNGEPHRVALSSTAVAILATMAKGRRTSESGELVFEGTRAGVPISNGTMAKANRQVAPLTTVHGWRSTFRDWAGETTSYPADALEACLAHSVGNEVQRSYQRGDMLDKRREIMNAWAAYLASTPAIDAEPAIATATADVIPFAGRERTRAAA